jgi:hypothetical protein
MSGSELAKAKEAAAQKMREKQAAGTRSPFLPYPAPNLFSPRCPGRPGYTDSVCVQPMRRRRPRPAAPRSDEQSIPTIIQLTDTTSFYQQYTT